MYLKNEDTICAPATVPGTGAISVIRVSGSEALSIADKVIRCKGQIADAKGYTIKFGTVFTADGKALDEVLVSIFKAPHSYTGENSIEISCHASMYIVNGILELLFDAGARLAEPGEFTLRAYLSGKMDLSQAEAVADLISSQNAAAHRVAFNQMKGGFSGELKEMRSQLLNIVSLMELELDFSEEEVEFADRAQLNSLLERVLGHISRLTDSFRLGNAIKNGIPVAIAGATNAGKSTLLNALLGEERAIVSDIHGTTRDTIEETLNIDGVLYRFIDTAGIRETSEVVERIGIERTFRKLSEAEIVIGMLDGTKDFNILADDLSEVLSHVDLNEQKVVILVNKSDMWAADGETDSKTAYLSEKGSDSDGKKVRISPHLLDNKNVNLPNKVVSLIDNLIKDINVSKTGKNDGTDSPIVWCFEKSSDCISSSEKHISHDGYISPSEQIFAGRGISSSDHACSDEQISPVLSGAISIIGISAKTGEGIETLRRTLSAYSKDRLGDSDTTLVTNARHYQALSDARTSLSRVKEGLSVGIPTDLIAQDIREAITHLGEITGTISSQDVLNNVFKNFCIGK